MDATGTLELVRRAQGGDRDALERLFQRYHERTLRIVRMRLGRELRTKLESGDILQRVFLGALQGFSDFTMRHESSFLLWLAQLVEWQIRDQLDYFKAARRDLRREVAPPEPASGSVVGLDPVAGDTGPADQAAHREDRELVEECLEDLAPEMRELILLRDYAGCTWEEMSSRLSGRSIGTIRVQHARAWLELGKRLRARSPGWDRD